MKILRVGDPHIKPSNIAEAEKLMTFVKKIAVDAKVDRLEILGDLFHTHAIVRLEVLEFWNRWLQDFAETVETIVLVGNHDMPGHYATESNSLNIFKRIKNGNLRIIDRPTVLGPFVYCPYIHGESDFLRAVHGIADTETKILVCHAEFSGSQYDNGFYAPHGFNPDLVKYAHIISGHIHKTQVIALGRVDYPGTAKWDSASDANESKGIWLYEHDVNGKVLQRDLISTAHVVTPIVSFTWIEGEDAPAIPEGSKASVELVGSSDWISKKKSSLKGKVSISSKFTDQKRKLERKAGNSLESYMMNTYDTKMDRTKLIQFARELGIVQVNN